MSVHLSGMATSWCLLQISHRKRYSEEDSTQTDMAEDQIGYEDDT